MFLLRADPLRGQVGGGWALEIKSFLGPVKWHRADRRVPFGAQIQYHYIRGCIYRRCIGSFMYKSPWVTLTGCKKGGGFRVHTTPPVRLSNITAPVRLSNITTLLPPITKLIRNQEEL